MDFFGVGISELFFIVLFCLIFFKPEELPGIVRTVVQHIKKFRSVTSKVQKDIGDIYHREIESKFEEAKEELENASYGVRTSIEDEYHKLDEHIQSSNNEIQNIISTQEPVVNPELTTSQNLGPVNLEQENNKI